MHRSTAAEEHQRAPVIPAPQPCPRYGQQGMGRQKEGLCLNPRDLDPAPGMFTVVTAGG